MSTDKLSLLSLFYSPLGHLSSESSPTLPDEKAELFSSEEPAALPLFALHAFYVRCWIIDEVLQYNSCTVCLIYPVHVLASQPRCF
jgi:hypothetical protein